MNPVVAIGHQILRNKACYDFYQEIVGGVSYRKEFTSRFLNSGELSVLDLGCGTGALISDLSPTTNYFGIDISDKYLDSARLKRPSGTFLNASVSTEWSNSLQLGRDVLTTALGLFHHINDEELDDLLLQLANALEPGSRVVSVDPVILDSTSPIARWFASNDRGRYLRTPSKLEEKFRSHGFSCEITCQKNKFRIPLDTVEIVAHKS